MARFDPVDPVSVSRSRSRLLPGRRPARLPVAQRDLRPAHPGGESLRLPVGDLAGQLDAGNRGRRSYPADPASIAEALVAGVAPDRDRLRDMGLRRAGEFTWAAAAASTLDVYREVAERRRRRRA
jgi:hypothetical protein